MHGIRNNDWQALRQSPTVASHTYYDKETTMQRSPFKATVAAALAAALAAACIGAQAGTVTVLTSFPKELTTAYQKAFEAATRHQDRDPEQEHHRVRGLRA